MKRAANNTLRCSLRTTLAGLIACVISMLIVSAALAEELRVTVADPYLEMHSGPGRGYPVLHVAEEGEKITIVSRRNSWFQVVEEKGKLGWVKREQMARTLGDDSEPLIFEEVNRDDFDSIRWEAGIGAGEIEGSSVNSIYGGYNFSAHISTEITGMQVLGDVSESEILTFSVLIHPFPAWRVSPFLGLGVGSLKVKARSGISQVDDRVEDLNNVGLGARVYLTQRFFLRFDYKNYKVLTDKNDNYELEEWKAGLSVFF